jgi:hypothetical protein
VVRWAVYLKWHTGKLERIETWDDPKVFCSPHWWVLAALPLPEVTVVEGK